MDIDSFKILLIEDNPGDAALIRVMLSESSNERYELEYAKDLVSGLKLLSSEEIDTILLDLHLPDSQGIQTYNTVRTGAGQIPIIALTGLQNEETAFELFRNGVQDYLVKGQINSQVLTLSIRHAIDRTRTAIKLQLSEARFRKLIETMTDTIIIVDKEGLVQFINQAGESLFKTTSADFLGQPFGFPIVEHGQAEIELFAWHGDPVIAEMHVVETDWEGNPAWLACLRDITDRKKLELSLEKTSRELNQFVVQLETANKKILENQNSLIEEERLKVLLQMAGTTAHELNQPLTVLLGNIGFLESLKDDPEELSDCLHDIEDAGKKIAAIVRKVQNIRKYETRPYVAGQCIINLEQTIKILSVEDSDDDFEVLKRSLEDNPRITLIRARDIDNALKRLEKETFDLILLDHILPDGTGFTFSELLHKNDMDIPVIIITGQGDEIVASRLILEGAYDYIPKPMVTKDVLNRSIGNTMEKVRLKREISTMHDKIQEMAMEDKLTRLHNRRYFQTMLENEMERNRRYAHKLVLSMMDLDHFKQINDTYGHLAGDMVLATVGNIIRESFRESDVACRYGGEEFAVLMPDISLENAQLVCDRLREKVAGFKFRYEESDFQISISIGIAKHHISQDKEPDDLIKRADQALYQAKEQGRNQVVFINCQDDGIEKKRNRK